MWQWLKTFNKRLIFFLIVFSTFYWLPSYCLPPFCGAHYDWWQIRCANFCSAAGAGVFFPKLNIKCCKLQRYRIMAVTLFHSPIKNVVGWAQRNNKNANFHSRIVSENHLQLFKCNLPKCKAVRLPIIYEDCTFDRVCEISSALCLIVIDDLDETHCTAIKRVWLLFLSVGLPGHFMMFKPPILASEHL